ncbi:unnamed protein product [Dicrocoelium dendriticum]|nr:unnamed protein product [Dicrocoelium dendriticum]
MIGGRTLTTWEHTWLTRITENVRRPVTQEPRVCTGVVISKDCVLTVASCFGITSTQLQKSECLPSNSIAH